ncbi:MAG: DUF1365 domain-containing protein [Acidobacteria bacterium]|nr:DUF1365 domain-containing protein [Acidobacteriota bacterium]
MESAICTGNLRHRRFTPVKHDFTYPIFMVLMDIDCLADLVQVSPFISHNRWNWAAFYERDHFGEPHLSLRERLAQDAEANGLALPDGRIFLLTHLRYCGYVFNPVSFFYCYDRAESLQAIVAEVNNTFGDSENYWLASHNEWRAEKVHRYRDAKRMHVSPFNRLHLDYTFVFNELTASNQLMIHMNTIADGQVNLDATLQLERRAWSGKALHQALLKHPWMTAKVITAIHWQALKLYWKGAKFYPDPGVRQKEKGQSKK